MKYRRLGLTSLFVSEISLGCSGYWGDYRFDEGLAVALVRQAFDLGLNFYDTGHNYSNFNAEPRLGVAIREILAQHDRDELVISSKAGSLRGRAPILGLHNRHSTQDFSADSIEQSCINSIQNLGCSYLDIFQLHGIPPSALSISLLNRLERMRSIGLYLFLGINTHDTEMIEFISKHPGLCDMVLLDYNVLQLDREPLIERLVLSGVGVVAGTVLAQGHIVKSKIGSIRTGSFFWYLARSLLKPSSRNLARSSSRMRKLLAGLDGIKPSQAAFAYILSNPLISSCVFGTTSIPNLIEVIGSTDLRLEESSRLAIRECFEELEKQISA